MTEKKLDLLKWPWDSNQIGVFAVDPRSGEISYVAVSAYPQVFTHITDLHNACAGVAEMGSVRELVEALTDASEVVRDRLHMAEAAGNKKDIKWASEILADAQAALAKFRLEENQ